MLSLSMPRALYVSTVRSPTASAAAIVFIAWPRAIRVSTSVSRSLSSPPRPGDEDAATSSGGFVINGIDEHLARGDAANRAHKLVARSALDDVADAPTANI